MSLYKCTHKTSNLIPVRPEIKRWYFCPTDDPEIIIKNLKLVGEVLDFKQVVPILGIPTIRAIQSIDNKIKRTRNLELYDPSHLVEPALIGLMKV